MSNAMRYTALGLAGAATVLLILCQFLPMQKADESGADFTSSLWQWKVETGGFDQDDNWGDWPGNDDGTGMMQAGGWVFTAGLAAAGVAALLLGIGQRRIGAVCAFGATALALTGFILWTAGFGQLEDGDVADESDPHVAFYFAIAGMVLLAVAGVLGLLGGNSPRPASSRSSRMNF